jgi:hypothetical protein
MAFVESVTLKARCVGPSLLAYPFFNGCGFWIYIGHAVNR